ncbi:MAG: ATP synthase F1 subunit delta [Chloroflexi bacterium RBG_13_51_18]|nr:MAG: ATP synthase F1 subunit delta [Chloroflexi bacterium RBG_13_51_18]
MAKKANPRRYAQAVFEIALEKNELELWQTDLQKVVDAVSEGDFLAALESPRIKFEVKSRLLKEHLESINPLALNLLLLLISRLGIGMISEIAREYHLLLNAHRGIQPADVVTAIPLDDKDEKELAEKLSALVNAKVELKSRVEPEILGGVVVRVGGKLLDGSTRSKLLALKKELVRGEIKS